MLPGEREAWNSDRRRGETGAGCLWIILFTILIWFLVSYLVHGGMT